MIATLLEFCVISFSCFAKGVEGHVENIARLRRIEYSGLAI